MVGLVEPNFNITFNDKLVNVFQPRLRVRQEYLLALLSSIVLDVVSTTIRKNVNINERQTLGNSEVKLPYLNLIVYLKYHE